MGKDKDIHKALKQWNSPSEAVFIATVTQVNKTDKTVSVIDNDELDYDDVRLTSVINDKNSVVQYPVLGSTVLVCKIGNDDNTLFVSAMSEVDSIAGTIATTEFNIDKEGFELKRNEENLKTVLNDQITEFGKLCDEVSKIVVMQGTSPNVAAITAIRLQVTTEIKQRLNTILK